MDVQVVNQPKYLSEKASDGKNDYVFADYLEPGMHHFIIYDPREKRAYCQEIFVEASKVDPLPVKKFAIKKPPR